MSIKTFLIVLGVVIILLVVAGVIFIYKPSKNPNTVQQSDNNAEKLQNTAINPTAIPVPNATLFVTSDGLAPHQIEVNTGSTLTVTNNTSAEVTIKVDGLITSEVIVPAKKTVTTQYFRKSGEIKAWLLNNPKNIVSITVK